MSVRQDPSLDALLHLDGESFALDEVGSLWVKFEATSVAVSIQRPHGIKYSLTLASYDHQHKGERIRFYVYTDAVTLLTDFWQAVEQIVQERSYSRWRC